VTIETHSDGDLPAGLHRIVLWDWPVRALHWSFAVLVPMLWWTAQSGEFGWHRRLGLILAGLLVLRILLGLFGSETARFAQFVKGPRAIFSYLRRRGPDYSKSTIGHNPIGGWSVIAMLAVMLAQVGLGMFAGDPDDGVAGPLNHLLSFSAGLAATQLHEVLFNVIVVVVAMHICAVMFYLLARRSNLIGPMVTGRRIVPVEIDQPKRAPGSRLLVCAIAATAVVLWLSNGAPGF
jgi:cytochrome b